MEKEKKKEKNIPELKSKTDKSNDKKHKERINRLSLTLMFSVAIFIILFIAIGLTIGIIYLLIALEAVQTVDEGNLTITPVLIYVCFISLVIGFGISMLLVRFPLKPFNRIISLMNRLSSGDFKARLHFGKPLTAISALTEVSDSFNKMAEELENTEVLRSDFINNFSHEFKTPIVSIAGFAKLLKKGNLSEKEKAEYIDIIEKESLRLSSLATNVFNLTKIENQTILTEINEYNPAEQIRHCVLLLENKWSEKEIDFNLELEDILIFANEESMEQVWINLIDNAIKFSSNKSTIDIKMKKEETTTSFTITNTGVTICKDNIDRIFRKFYQADESHAAEGNGVGLAIVKKIVELHKGKITVESENGVTSFTVTI